MMIVTELRLQSFVFIVFLLTKPNIIVNAGAGRCYLCAESTLPQCAGSSEPDSPVYTNILQYYTEPCNGQCILFRSINDTIIRGCSWTYGHMLDKSTGWHELNSGIRAYFCNSPLCNNGTYEKMEISMTTKEITTDVLNETPTQTLTPQQLFTMTGYTPSTLPLTDQPIVPIDPTTRQLRQCYACTARVTGCGEYLDPRHAGKFIQPCTTSCLVFRNPNDHHLITRDCSEKWPQVHAKSGLHKLLGTDAFFCQESLCNGISFEFIMGIFHNQLPAVIKFPPMQPPFEVVPISATISSSTTTVVTTSVPSSHSTTAEIDENDIVWEVDDDDNDDDAVEDLSMFKSPTTITTSTITSTLPFFTDFIGTTYVPYETSSIPVSSFEHFNFVQAFPASSTIAGGLAVAQQDHQLNWWDLSDASFSPPIQSNDYYLTTTIPILKNNQLSKVDQDEWSLFDTTTTTTITPMNHADPSSETIIDGDIDMNEIFAPTLSTTSNNINKNSTALFVPYYFEDFKPKDDVFNSMKPLPTLPMPPFSWMLHLANQNGLKNRRTISNQTLRMNTTISRKTEKIRKLQSKNLKTNSSDDPNEHCNKKQCQNGGRLNSNCLCICLPAYSGDDCQIVNCNQEPAYICDFVLENECKNDYVRYLCPKFCQMNICSTNKSS